MKADVVVAAGENARACLDAVYQFGGDALGRVIAVCDPPHDALISALQDRHVDLVVLRNEANLGSIASWNRGLFLRQRDVLLLDNDAELAEGCLREMLEVLDGSDRIASVAAMVGSSARIGDFIPRWTDVPTARGPGLLLRHVVLNMIGGFDPAFACAEDAQDDWAMRAQRMGLRHVRANRARVLAAKPARIDAEPASTALLLARYAHLPEQARAALLGAEPHAAAHLMASKGGPLRVCTAPPRNGEPLEHFQILYTSAPIEDAGKLLALLESPCHLILGEPGASRNRTLLFAAAHSAQAVVTASEQERTALIAELALDPERVEVVDSAELMPVFRRVVEHPSMSSLRFRALLANFLRSLKESADQPRTIPLAETAFRFLGGR